MSSREGQNGAGQPRGTKPVEGSNGSPGLNNNNNDHCYDNRDYSGAWTQDKMGQNSGHCFEVGDDGLLKFVKCYSSPQDGQRTCQSSQTQDLHYKSMSTDGTESSPESAIEELRDMRPPVYHRQASVPFGGSVETMQPLEYTQSWLNKHDLISHNKDESIELALMQMAAENRIWKRDQIIKREAEASLQAAVDTEGAEARKDRSETDGSTVDGIEPPEKKPKQEKLSQESSTLSTVTSSLSSWNSPVVAELLDPNGSGHQSSVDGQQRIKDHVHCGQSNKCGQYKLNGNNYDITFVL